MATRISGAPLDTLRASMRGSVIMPDDASYDDARKVWNGDIDRRPAAIIRCARVEDVQAALTFARETGLPISIKSGGHSLPGHSIADDALMIDLRPMNQVTIDATTQRATVGGGAIWSEVDQPAQELGLAVTGGHVSHTGVAGLTLGGGIGHLMRKFGLVVDNLISAEIVTADGRVLQVSATENPDLFWAIRGGGGNFGIATRLEFQLAPLGPIVLGGLAFWAPEHGPELMRRWREFCKTAPDEVTTILAYLHAPPFDFVPKDVQLKPGYALVAVGTDIPIAENAIRELRAFQPPLFDIIGPMPYLAVQTMFDPALPHGTQTYFKAHSLYDLSDDALRTIHTQTAKMPPGHTQMLVAQMGGAVARVADDETAFGGRKTAFHAMCIGVWEDPAQRADVVSWVRTTHSDLEPYAHGVYVNLADTMDEKALQITYGPEKYAKLQKLKAKYDPSNVFKLNQNIKPAK